MRSSLAVVFASVMLGSGAMATVNTPDAAAQKHAAVSRAHQLRNARAKTTGNPLPSSPTDPDAGSSEQGTPNPTVTNGSELAH
jgi:hypothetical protein